MNFSEFFAARGDGKSAPKSTQQPSDAVRTFFSSGMDALILGNFVVEK
jgi:hypothetical protein